MADTIFNIFGDELQNPVHKQILRVHKSNENATVGKPSISSNLTPAKISFNCPSPRLTDQKKKSFLFNNSTPIQQCPGDYKKSHFQNIKKSFTQIYEDVPTMEQAPISQQDEIEIQYTPSIINDDAYMSDSETVVSDDNIDKLVYDLPQYNDIPLPSFKTFTMEMDTSLDPISFNDALIDDSLTALDHEHDISDGDLPVPF